jgi:hypothetical protein
MCFLADHGNVAWRAGLTIVGSEADGQGGACKACPSLGKGFIWHLGEDSKPWPATGSQFTTSILLVGCWLWKSFGKVKECILVPRKAFINALSLPIPGFFSEPPKDNGNDNQKLLIKNSSWDEIPQTGYFIFNKVEKVISGAGWQVSLREDVVK